VSSCIEIKTESKSNIIPRNDIQKKIIFVTLLASRLGHFLPIITLFCHSQLRFFTTNKTWLIQLRNKQVFLPSRRLSWIKFHCREDYFVHRLFRPTVNVGSICEAKSWTEIFNDLLYMMVQGGRWVGRMSPNCQLPRTPELFY
jgi:hypothetical protein